MNFCENEIKNKIKNNISSKYIFNDYNEYKTDEEVFFCINNSLYSLYLNDNTFDLDIIFYDKSAIYQFTEAFNIDEKKEIRNINSIIDKIKTAYNKLFNFEFEININKLEDIITEIYDDGYYYFYSVEIKEPNNNINIGIFIDAIFNFKENKVFLKNRYYLDHPSFETIGFENFNELINNLYNKYRNN